MEKSQKTKLFQKISVKITLLIILILSLGIGSTIAYYLWVQNRTIIESREKAVMDEGDVVYQAIKNNMLAGEAPIAVELFNDLQNVEDIGGIKLFRADGISAFSDNKTVNEVNKILKEKEFSRKTIFSKREKNEDPNFHKSVKTVSNIFVSDVAGKNKTLVIYRPLLNQPKCSTCHGVDHFIRGIIKISSPVDDIYRTMNLNIIISGGIYGFVLLILTILIIKFLRNFIINRIFKIGTVVNGVGSGDFRTKIDEKRPDEIGRLAKQINDMIDGLNERFKLSKFVSRSTLEHIKHKEDLSLGGEKNVMTVLFSDIRGFTSYSESRDPDEVMKTLNEVMNLQADIIQEFGGDIDKFVGDEIMAIFERDDMAIRALKASEKIIHNMRKRSDDGDHAIHVGIGVNTGEMISGNMGSGDRMDRTVIGDAVNLGARLCSIAGKNVVVLSEHTYNLVRDNVEVVPHDPIKIKGKEKPVKIYTLRKTL